MLRFALQGVVEHGKNFFIVVFPALAICNFIKIYTFIDHDHKAEIADLCKKDSPKLEIIIPVVVSDHGVDRKGGLGFASCTGFAAQPAQRRCACFVVPVAIGFIICAQNRAEIKAADLCLQLLQNGENFSVYRVRKFRSARRKACRGRLALQRGKPFSKHDRERAALCGGFFGEVSDQLAIGRQPSAV